VPPREEEHTWGKDARLAAVRQRLGDHRIIRGAKKSRGRTGREDLHASSTKITRVEYVTSQESYTRKVKESFRYPAGGVLEVDSESSNLDDQEGTSKKRKKLTLR